MNIAHFFLTDAYSDCDEWYNYLKPNKNSNDSFTVQFSFVYHTNIIMNND